MAKLENYLTEGQLNVPAKRAACNNLLASLAGAGADNALPAAIRKFTTKIPIEVIVVDNGSEDESLDYLRGLKWIQLIERRKQDLPAFWVDGFVSALDIGFANSRSDVFHYYAHGYHRKASGVAGAYA